MTHWVGTGRHARDRVGETRAACDPALPQSGKRWLVDGEIKTKIKSVQNTRKVTRALEMVSASKIRKAQDRMKASRPYARAMKQVIGHLAQANSEFQHPYLVERKAIKRVGYVIVSSDRGLAGGLNNNLFRKLLGEFRQWQEKGVEVDVVTIGQKASVFFRRIKVNMVGSVLYRRHAAHGT